MPDYDDSLRKGIPIAGRPATANKRTVATSFLPTLGFIPGYLSLSILLSVITRTLEADMNLVTFSGDTAYASIVPTQLTTKTTYPSVVNNPYLKVVYGTIFNQFGSNMTIVDCAPIGIDQPQGGTNQVAEEDLNWNTTCLLAPTDTTSSNYQLVVFSAIYPQDGTPVFTWHKQAVTNLFLPPNKNYFLYPSDSSMYVYIAATETVNTQTTLLFVQLRFDGFNKSMVSERNLTAPGLVVSGGVFNLEGFSKAVTGVQGVVILMNTVNSTKPYEGSSAQPTNRKFLVVYLPGLPQSPAAYLSEFQWKDSVMGTGRDFSYLLDLEALNDHLIFIGLDKDGAQPLTAVAGCYKAIPTSSQLNYDYTTKATFWPIKLDTMNGNKNFFHLVVLRDKLADNDYQILIANHTFDGNPTNLQKLTFNLVWNQAIWPNQKDPIYLRPAEADMEIRPVKFGMRNSQINIKYLFAGNLQYIDLLSFYKIDVRLGTQKVSTLDIFDLLKPPKAKPTDPANIEGLELQRIAVPTCDKAFSMFSRAADLGVNMHDNKYGLPLHCITKNVKISSWGDKDGYNYRVLVSGTYPADQLQNVTTTVTYYDPIPTNAGTFSQPETRNCILEKTSPLYYAKVFPKQAENRYSLTVARYTNQKLVAVPMENIVVGSNVSFVPVTTYPNVKIVNQKILPIQIVKTDSGGVVADERWTAGSYVIIEEIRRSIAVLATSEVIDYQTGIITRKATQVADMALDNSVISRTRDEIEDCDAIMILVMSKTTNLRTMIVFEKTGNKLYKIATTSVARNQHILGCSKSSFVFLAWDQNSQTSSLEEFVYNRQAKALVTPPATPTGFGLKGMTNIRKGYMSKSDILFTTWNTGSKILEIQAWKLFDSNPATPKFELDPRMEYRYLDPSVVGKEPDISFCHKNYVVFNMNLTEAKVLQGIQSEYFLGFQKNYFSEENINLQNIGISVLQGVIPHKTKLVSAYSAYGIQFVPRPGDPLKIDNYTIIATFINGVDVRGKVYNIFNTTRVFNTIRATDDNNEKIYFHLKEFVGGQTEIFQLSLNTAGQALANFGAVEQSQLLITLAAKNNEAEYSKIFITVNFQSVSKIEVTPVKDLDYKQDLVLSLLPGMASSIKGSILQIALFDSNAVLQSNRITGGAETQMPQAMRPQGWVPRENSKVYGISQFRIDASLVVEDQTIYINRARNLISACNLNSNREVTHFHTSEVQNAAGKVFVVYREDESELKQMIVTLATNDCSAPVQCKQKKDQEPVITAPDVDKLGDIVLVPVSPIAGLGATSHVLVLLGKGSQTTYYLFDESGGKSLYDPLVGARHPESLDNPSGKVFDELPSYLTDCSLIQEDEVDKNPILVIVCILFEKDIAKNQTARRLYFLSINFSFAAGGKIYARPMINPVADTDPLRKFFEDGVKITHCIFYAKDTVSCAAFNIYGAFIQFFLGKNPTCSDNLAYCLTLRSERYSSVLHGSLDNFSGDISKNYVVISGRKSTVTGSGNEAIAYLYKLGDTNTVYYSQPLGNIEPKANFYCQFYRDNDPPEISFFQSSNLTFRKYQIGEVQVRFTAATRDGLKGTLNFSNADPTTNHYQLKLQDLFKPPVLNNTTNTANAVAPKSFFAQYWWAFAGGAAVLLGVVGFYFYRREMLIRSRARLSDETVLSQLEEFHYAKRS